MKLSEKRIKELAAEASTLDGIGAAPYRNVVHTIQKALAEAVPQQAEQSKTAADLRAEHDRYHETGMCYGDSHADLVAAIERAEKAEQPSREDDRRDAERYRWLRKIPNIVLASKYYGDRLDDEIDSARRSGGSVTDRTAKP